ncbi:penicillin-binding transpeptidase domain-containing protein [Puia sp. P3]|uniref:penicillin-binding transpeptidase domain-containing protein n=1 Tax=Puia sp. P3 TaxID=3423952 RepID=UPI003D676FF9
MSRTLVALFAAALLFAACSPNNVTVDNSLQRYFDSAGVKGSFALFDNGQGHFTIYNLPRYKDSVYAPGRTFDIVQSLVALQTGVIKDDTSGLVWTSFFALPYPGIAGDTSAKGLRSLKAAFRDPARLGDIDFVGLAARIGKDTLKKWIDSLRYGNKDISGPIDSCWLDNHLKVTADEQLGLTKRLYFDQLPFFNRPQQLVRGIMPTETNSNYRLVYKTGQVVKEDGHALGWVLGWVEENKHPYFFVVNMEAEASDKDLGPIGLHIVKNILGPMGFFEGKK